jgi:hypothetical protein
MNRSDQWKLLGVVAATVLAVWYLYPSIVYYSMTPAQQERMAPNELKELRRPACF